MCACSVFQSCPTHCDSIDCSLPGSSPGKTTGVGCHLLLQGLFPTQGSNLYLWHLLHCRQILYHWATWESQFVFNLMCIIGIWLWKPVGLDWNFHRTGEKRISWRAQTKPCVHQDPGERNSDPKRDWVILACECPGVSNGGMDQHWPVTGSGALTTTVLGGTTCQP